MLRARIAQVAAAAILGLFMLAPASGAADEAQQAREPPPRVIVTALAGAGNQFVLRGLAEVRIVDALYAGAGYGAVVQSPVIIYHGPSVRAGYRLPLGELAAVTPRAGVDVVAFVTRSARSSEGVLTSHFPLATTFGVMAGLYPSVLVLEVEANVSVGGVTYEQPCSQAGPGECAPGAETTGVPRSEALLGAHGGLVVGLAL